MCPLHPSCFPHRRAARATDRGPHPALEPESPSLAKVQLIFQPPAPPPQSPGGAKPSSPAKLQQGHCFSRNPPCLRPSHLQAGLGPWGCRRGLPAALALSKASRRLAAEPAPFSGPCSAEHPRECGRCASCPLGPEGQGDRRGYLPRQGRSQHVPPPGAAELGLAGGLLGGSCFPTSNSMGAIGGFTWKTLQSPACGRGGGHGCRHLLTGNQRDQPG